MFKIKRSVDGQFYWTLVARNGETLCNSEMFTRKEKAVQSATAVIDLILSNEDIEIGDFTKDMRTINGLVRKPDESEEETR